MTPRVYVILLNWNNSPDTTECLESLLRVDYPDYQIVVCENASADDSVARLRSWAAGTLAAPAFAAPLAHLGHAPRAEPGAFVEMDQATAEQGDVGDAIDARLVMIHNPVNLGFAGGNNVGLRYVARAAKPTDLVCLLNNDTVVSREWMTRMVRAIEDDSTVGAVGAMLYEYYLPDLVESAGGGLVHAWQGMPRETTARRQRRGTPATIPRRLDFLTGACFMLRVGMLEQLGLIDERYFIYCEDVDFSLRIRDLGKRLVLVPDAEMWHKNGGVMRHSSPRHDYYIARNSLLLVHKFNPLLLPAALAFSVYRCLLPKIVRGDVKRLRAVWAAYRDAFAFMAGRISAAGIGASVPPRG